MAQIEHRVEQAGEQPDYSGREFAPEEIEAGAHRAFIGGVWDTHGERQLEYLKAQGLHPHHRLVDIGCGPFRAGRHLIDYLEPGNYYAVDANHSLIQAGYDVELSDEQRDRLPVTNLRANDRFDVDFGVPFDFAIAQSVFTHVSLNHIRLCLHRLAPAMREGGEFYATFFVRPPVHPGRRGHPLEAGQAVLQREERLLALLAGPEVGGRASLPGATRSSATGVTRPTRRWRSSCASPRPPRQRAPSRTGTRATTLRRGRRWLARHLDPSGGGPRT